MYIVSTGSLQYVYLSEIPKTIYFVIVEVMLASACLSVLCGSRKQKILYTCVPAG